MDQEFHSRDNRALKHPGQRSRPKSAEGRGEEAAWSSGLAPLSSPGAPQAPPPSLAPGRLPFPPTSCPASLAGLWLPATQRSWPGLCPGPGRWGITSGSKFEERQGAFAVGCQCPCGGLFCFVLFLRIKIHERKQSRETNLF